MRAIGCELIKKMFMRFRSCRLAASQAALEQVAVISFDFWGSGFFFKNFNNRVFFPIWCGVSYASHELVESFFFCQCCNFNFKRINNTAKCTFINISYCCLRSPAFILSHVVCYSGKSRLSKFQQDSIQSSAWTSCRPTISVPCAPSCPPC